MENNNQEIVNEVDKVINELEEVKEQVEPKPEPKKEEVPLDDRHTAEDPMISIEEYKVEGENKRLDRPVVPSANYEETEKAYEQVLKADRKQTGPDKMDLTSQEKEALSLLIASSRFANRGDVLSKQLNENQNDIVNDINFGDDKLNIKPISFKKTDKAISGANAVAIFRSYMSIGDVVHVPLWHSGFWVVLKPPTQTEIVNLQLALANNEITLGRDTNALIYSNYSVVFTRILSEFIVNHINTSSLQLNDDEDIRDYISLHDFYPLVAALLASMNPDGIDISRGCINGAKVSDDGKPKCTFSARGKIDAKKIVWLNRAKLTKSMLTHMSNKGIKVVSKQEIKEYQLKIESLKPKTYDIKTSMGVEFKVVFETPSLKENIVMGEEWVNDIIALARKLFTDQDNEDSKNAKIEEIAFSSILGIYNTFIKEFIYADGKVNRDKTTFNTILSDVSLDEEAFNSFITAIKDFISTSPIAIVATPNFTCPECHTKQNQDGTGDFKEFIPLNIVEHFFVHCAFRLEKARNRKI